MLNHSHKKQKDSLETRAVLLAFLLETENMVAALGMHQNTEKRLLSLKNFLMRMTLRLILRLSVVRNMVMSIVMTC